MQILINNVDEIVSAIYKKNDIDDSHDFQNTKQEHLMSKVSSYFNIKVHFTDDISESNYFGQSYRIFLDVIKREKSNGKNLLFILEVFCYIDFTGKELIIRGCY